MPFFDLPVSRLTGAVIRHRYGDGPVKLDAADVRRQQLMHTGPKDKHLERKRYVLIDRVMLALNRHEYDHVKAHAAEIGYYMHAHAKRRIYQFVHARATGGQTAQ